MYICFPLNHCDVIREIKCCLSVKVRENVVNLLPCTWFYLKAPSHMKIKPSMLPAVEAPHPGASYNPAYEDYQVIEDILCNSISYLNKVLCMKNQYLFTLFLISIKLFVWKISIYSTVGWYYMMSNSHNVWFV